MKKYCVKSWDGSSHKVEGEELNFYGHDVIFHKDVDSKKGYWVMSDKVTGRMVCDGAGQSSHERAKSYCKQSLRAMKKYKTLSKMFKDLHKEYDRCKI